MSTDYSTTLEFLAEDRDEWMQRARAAENRAANHLSELKKLQSEMLDARHVLQHLIWVFGCKDRHGIGGEGDIVSDVECLRQLIVAALPSGGGQKP